MCPGVLRKPRSKSVTDDGDFTHRRRILQWLHRIDCRGPHRERVRENSHRNQLGESLDRIHSRAVQLAKNSGRASLTDRGRAQEPDDQTSQTLRSIWPVLARDDNTVPIKNDRHSSCVARCRCTFLLRRRSYSHSIMYPMFSLNY